MSRFDDQPDLPLTEGASAPPPGAVVGRRRLKQRLTERILHSPALVWSVLILMVFAVTTAGLVLFGRSLPKYTSRQVADETRAARVAFDIVDAVATQSDRDLARVRTARVYVAEERVLAEIKVSLENLPRAIGDATSVDQLAKELTAQFGIDDSSLAALRARAATEDALTRWKDQVAALDFRLRLKPIVSPGVFQLQQLAQSPMIELRRADEDRRGAIMVASRGMFSLVGESARRAVEEIVSDAGFEPDVAEVAIARVMHAQRPTYRFDENAWKARQDEDAADTADRIVRFGEGSLLFQRGDVLTPEKIQWAEAERVAFRASLVWWQRFLTDLSAVTAGLLGAIGLGAAAATLGTRLARQPKRLLLVASLLTFGLLVSVLTLALDPRFGPAACAIPAAFVAMILCVTHDRRTAIGLGALLGLVSAIAVQQPVEVAAATLVGIGVLAWKLNDVRYRGTLIGAGVWSGLVVAIASILLSGLTRMLTPAAINQTVVIALTSGIGVALMGFIVLGILPLIERAFGITTGLTLIELRDPAHPLLRNLQQRAPGTYNHSVNVAVLAEAAAEAIGADALLAYVGALYHDVGKMNKPEFFVENQSGGINRHDKLTPAMSLLVIVGHVRDGAELAHQHRLPKSLHHFIEAHHGTTLVEYFYHRARRAAEAAAVPSSTAVRPMPQEIEYRYPGPKPRTREVAILMVCDAAESATRTLTDASPAKIDSLVRAIAHKRLMDGQFDDCDLTLKELSRIIDAVSRTLSSFHHHRIVYPEGPATPPGRLAPPRPSAAVGGASSTPAPNITAAPLTQPGVTTGAAR